MTQEEWEELADIEAENSKMALIEAADREALQECDDD